MKADADQKTGASGTAPAGADEQVSFLPNLLGDADRSGSPADLLAVLQDAFAGSERAVSLDRLLTDLGVRSSWQPERFVRDLAVTDWLRARRLVIDGREFPLHQCPVLALLCQPPSDPQRIVQRQDVLRELDDAPDLTSALERLYAELSEIEALVRSPGASARLDVALFRVDLLRRVRDLYDELARPFEGASSRLRQIATTAEAVRSSLPYERLATLVDQVGRAQTLDVRLGIGATGRLTEFELLEASARRDPLRRSAWARRLQQLGLWWRHGVRVSEEELVARLVTAVWDDVVGHVADALRLLPQLEFLLLARAWRDECSHAGLQATLPEIVASAGESRAEGLFLPLLLQTVGSPPVPQQHLELQRGGAAVLTGPNSGGKTCLLRAVGWLQLLGQSGWYAPATDARIVPVEGLFVSIVEHEAVEHPEGRLGRELERIRDLFEGVAVAGRADAGHLAILDELCSGTNPTEAREVITTVLEAARRRGVTTLVTTHFLDFARQLEGEGHEKTSFLQVEVDPVTGPTYQVADGVASSSMARQVAERMGVTLEQLEAGASSPAQAGSPRAEPGSQADRWRELLGGSHSGTTTPVGEPGGAWQAALQTETSSERWLKRLVGVAVVVGAVGLIFAAVSWGSWWFDLPDIAPPPEIGEPLPPIEEQGVYGRRVAVDELIGRYVLIDVWGTWCPRCVSDQTLLSDALDRWPDDLAIVSLASDDADAVREFLAQQPLDWPVVAVGKSGTASKRYLGGVKQLDYPTRLLADREGRIVARTPGLGAGELMATLRRELGPGKRRL